MTITIKTALFFTTITCINCFFTYSDCDKSCRDQQISCIISEETKQYFVCKCLKDEIACALLATPVVVCLRPSAAPSGGKEIWDDFKNRNSSTTMAPPSPSPRPPPPSKNEIVKVSLSVGISLLIIAAFTIVMLTLRRKTRRQSYTALEGSNDTPYQNTVEERP